ncbi:hypothetical protein BDY21DRAFT_348780 [Lineolata rhizophorae]|uniref:Uncharacterized protein n=1 Tax=Lineolata rhizophorae TaxID=578093 RepID=A0A6A6NVK3_9PEZI|nr:hypothetical protein BDY21DRAFT_348780 [Lineolata rhizophorae]
MLLIPHLSSQRQVGRAKICYTLPPNGQTPPPRGSRAKSCPFPSPAYCHPTLEASVPTLTPP